MGRPDRVVGRKHCRFCQNANVTAGYYLPCSLNLKSADGRGDFRLGPFEKKEKTFFTSRIFAIAEVFSVFMKHCFGIWNRHLRRKGTIDSRVYESLVKQFQSDIHNGHFLYHYELNRYHVLGINLVAPIDHYFKISRRQKNVVPMSTFDHLVISMGVHLAHIHGTENVCIPSADGRLTDILKKCKSGIKKATVKKLKLDIAEEVTGRAIRSSSLPQSSQPQDCDQKRTRGSVWFMASA